MKKIIIILAVALVFSACPEYQSWPEPLLPLEEVEFSAAAYDSGTQTIKLTVSPSLPYKGIYPYYNKDSDFGMGSYLKGGISVKSTKVNLTGDNITSIDIVITGTKPSTLTFNTKEPMYLYREQWDAITYQIIEAKAFIKTDLITVL